MFWTRFQGFVPLTKNVGNAENEDIKPVWKLVEMLNDGINARLIFIEISVSLYQIYKILLFRKSDMVIPSHHTG